jgi:hypothetical protein
MQTAVRIFSAVAQVVFWHFWEETQQPHERFSSFSFLYAHLYMGNQAFKVTRNLSCVQDIAHMSTVWGNTYAGGSRRQ